MDETLKWGITDRKYISERDVEDHWKATGECNVLPCNFIHT